VVYPYFVDTSGSKKHRKKRMRMRRMIHSCCSMSHTQKGDVSPLGERAAGIAFFFAWNPLHPSVVLNKLVDFFLFF
jgi:hypothetical protein